jgi:hypothetical protein
LSPPHLSQTLGCFDAGMLLFGGSRRLTLLLGPPQAAFLAVTVSFEYTHQEPANRPLTIPLLPHPDSPGARTTLRRSRGSGSTPTTTTSALPASPACTRWCAHGRRDGRGAARPAGTARRFSGRRGGGALAGRLAGGRAGIGRETAWWAA